MKKVLFLTLLSAIWFSCETEIDFEDNRRIVVSGQLMNTSNTSLGGMNVEVYAQKGSRTFLSGPLENDVLIGLGRSDSNGEFNITAISPENADRIEVFININRGNLNQSVPPSELNRIDSDFTGIFLIAAENFPVLDDILDIGEVAINRVKSVTIELERISNLTDTLQYFIEPKPFIRDLSSSSDFPSGRTLFGSLNPDNFFVSRPAQSACGDTIVLGYRLMNQSDVEFEEQQIIIDEETNTFRFTF
ncbi:MAG: hypothetical protein AAF039_17710 [Bacteroidota bacterium]